jgi:penicillin-binding protein 1C
MSRLLDKRWRTWSITLLLVALGVLAIICVRYWPRAPLAARIPSSVAVFDSRGELLRLTLASDQQYRIWTPLEGISPQLVEALLLHEDRHFYYHLGVNPIALARAASATYTGGARQGGSTLSMQLARLLYGLNTRTVSGKCRQILLAVGLELRYSKHDLLEAHLNLMPYGGNVQGVGAASLVYFGKNADELVLSQALTLVVIPQSPSRRDPNGAEPASLRAARQRLFENWLKLHPDDVAESNLIAMPLRYAELDQLPFVAPHFTALLLERNKLATTDSTTSREIHTTLDLHLQRPIEQVVASYIHEQSRIGIHNAATMLLDYRDLSVRSMIGSADFYSAEIEGQVNGTLAKRSPGSALKPFIYALAMDQGLIHPMTVLKDAPTSFGAFSPENFDGRFAGPVTATEALTRSRNIPAVALSARLAEPSFYQFLRTAGISKLAPENHYGLALALGGGEITMEEAVALYAMLANRGVLAPIRYRLNDARSEGTRLLSEEASYMTLDMLASAQRPDGGHWAGNSTLRVAWKTGTSWGFRDAWTVGVFGPYVLAVWVGNFDGSSNPAFVGVQAAAPLFFRIVDAVAARNPNLREPTVTVPARLVHVEVCSASGDLPNADCPQTTSTWYIPGVSPIKVSQIHRRVWIDTRTGKQACAPYDRLHTRSEVFEFWPSDLQHLFAQAGMPRRKPPPDECGGESATGAAPRISSPVTNVTYSLRNQSSDSNFVPLTANVDGDVQRVHWFVDDAYVGTSMANEALAWRAQLSGRHLVRAIDDRGRADSRELNIAFVP